MYLCSVKARTVSWVTETRLIKQDRFSVLLTLSNQVIFLVDMGLNLDTLLAVIVSGTHRHVSANSLKFFLLLHATAASSKQAPHISEKVLFHRTSLHNTIQLTKVCVIEQGSTIITITADVSTWVRVRAA